MPCDGVFLDDPVIKTPMVLDLQRTPGRVALSKAVYSANLFTMPKSRAVNPHAGTTLDKKEDAEVEIQGMNAANIVCRLAKV